MLHKLGAAIYRGFFWTYERGTWQYDIMVVLILSFIFFTPRGWFHDQPVPPSDGVVLLSSSEHLTVYQLHAALIPVPSGETAQENILRDAERILKDYTGKAVQVTQVKPETDARGEIVSYAVWVQD
jgi:hypothetical protein